MTRWAKDLDPSRVLPEYPRPQMVRKEWQNLNGLWDVTLHGGKDRKILVPFAVECGLSGVGELAESLTYTRQFSIPDSWRGKRVLLHFGAVDYESTVSVNGKQVGTHRGGYDPFSFDITGALRDKGPQDLRVEVSDKTGDQPRGKQSTEPHGIWYTPTTGIWQTVWLEPVSEQFVSQMRWEPGETPYDIRLRAEVEGGGSQLQVTYSIRDQKTKSTVAELKGAAGEWVTTKWDGARLWTPEEPNLYDVEVKLAGAGKVLDQVQSYVAFRKVEIRQGEPAATVLLNGKAVFQAGPLDQGYWPDGIYTAPTDEALRYDIELTKRLGFNMTRKHVKVEPARWYYWCDKLGLLVWQDMPSSRNTSPEAQQQFEVELKRMVESCRAFPSIIMWVVFNEGWGQFDTERLTGLVKETDPSRLVSNASGWVDKAVGDIVDVHMYPGPGAPNPETTRAAVLGEFGGFGMPVPGHMFAEQNWGYQNVDSEEEFGRKWDMVWSGVYGLVKSHGLCAAVYTQLTDVETETNGLVTYDREVQKLPTTRISRGILGKLPITRFRVVVPTAQQEPAVWKYTTEEPPEGWEEPEFDDSSWQEGKSGFGTAGTPGAVVNTVWDTNEIWLRRTIQLPEEINARDLLFSIHHDEDCDVYINGGRAAKLFGYTTTYEALLIRERALEQIKPGPNVIAIRCKNTIGGQYIDLGFVVMEKESGPKK